MTWGEVILKGLEASGLKSDADQVKKFLTTNSDLGKLEFKPEEIGDTLLMTMEQAAGNVGLKQKIKAEVEGEVFGALARDTEEHWKKIAAKHNVDASILSDRTKKPWERIEVLKDLILEKETAALKDGKGKALPEDQVKAWEEKITSLRKELTGQLEAEKTARVQEVSNLQTKLKKTALSTLIANGEFGKLNSVATKFVPYIADQMLGDSDYEFQFDDNSGWSVIDRKTKSVATDAKTGKPLTITSAASKYVSEEYLDKGTGGGSGGAGGSGGSGGKKEEVLPEWKKKQLAEMQKMNS